MLTSIQSRFLRPSQPSPLGKGLARLGFTALLTVAAATAQTAFAQGAMGIDASGNTKSEMAACANGSSPQAKAVCMKEARNAAAAKRAGKLVNGGDFAANALMRCDVFKTDDDKSACKARVMNSAGAQGSVAAGGMLLEAETVVPAAK